MASLTELAFPDREDALDEVDVVPREAARLREPQSGRDEEREEGEGGPRTKPRAGVQEHGLSEQRVDLRLTVDVRQPPAGHAAEESGRWDLGGRVDHGEIAGELANDREPPGGLRRIAPGRRQRPGDGEIDGQGSLVSHLLRIAGKVHKQPSRCLETEPQPASEGEVLMHSVKKTRRQRHWTGSGQARATSASAGRSSLV